MLCIRYVQESRGDDCLEGRGGGGTYNVVYHTYLIKTINMAILHKSHTPQVQLYILITLVDCTFV